MYTIHPIRCGTIDGTVTKGGLTYLLDEGARVSIPVATFVVVADDPDDDRVVLVDAGAEDGAVSGREIEDGGFGPIRDGLSVLGLDPDDVDHLVLTHLHHDHAANVDRFPDAEVLVQRAELAAAHDPLPPMRRTYLDAHLEAVVDAGPTVVDGGFRLAEGLDLLHTPGHTEGMQSVVVRTAAGTHALIADLAYCRQNLEPSVTSITDVTGRTIETTPVDYDYVPPGLHVDVAACYESIARLRDRVGADGVLLGGHVPESLDGPHPRGG